MRQNPHHVQDVRERHADPFRYERPAFLTGQVSDLAAGRMALEIGNRKRCRASDHAVHREPPVGETAFLKVLERSAQWIDWVGERRVRNLAGRKLAGH